jgi:pentafunctional AROM polypeptide
MSFGVLGSAWPSIKITDKDCTDKTYPSFWDDLKLTFGVDIVPWNRSERAEGSSKPTSFVIIGMRGAGKTTLGTGAAKALGFTYLDLDAMIPNIKELVAKEGWPAFRAAESAVLKKALDLANSSNIPIVISCGGGIIEADANREILQTCGLPVVWVKRPIDHIESYLNSESSRPAYGETISEVYARREPLYRKCSTYEFSAARSADEISVIQKDFNLTVGSISAVARMVLRGNTYYCPLTAATLEGSSQRLASVGTDVDAVELRVDLLADLSLDNVEMQVRLARQLFSKSIIFTVLSEADGGEFAGSESDYWQLMEVGLRTGCEFLDVASRWDLSKRTSFLQRRGSARIIGSYRRLGRCTGTQDFNDICRAASCSGAADIVKVVFETDAPSDCLMVEAAAKGLRESTGITVPLLTYQTGSAGRMSQLLSTFMTPVSHAASPSAGLLTVAEVKQSRLMLGTHTPRQFFLFGTPISSSPSPTLHNVAFTKLQLPHTYGLCETDDVNVLLAKISEEQAGGGSVTIPLKEKVIPHMDELTPAAVRIGAVNTIIVERNRGPARWTIGDNTDWIGVMAPIKRNSPADTDWSTATALVVGAGGTSRAVVYGLQKLGCAKIIVYNRTAERAVELADSLGCDVCPSLDAAPTVQIVVSTITASVGFTLPPAVLESKPIVFDVNYKPAETPLMAQAKAARCIVIGGIEMLIAQGLQQCELWTMGAAPADEVRTKVYAHYNA